MRTAWRLIGLLFLVAALWWFRRDLLEALAILRARMTPALACGVVACTLLHFANEPIRWWVLLRRRTPAPTLSRVTLAVTATSLATYTLPARLGLPARVVVATKVLGLDSAAASAVLAFDGALTYAVWTAAAAGGAIALLEGPAALGPAVAAVTVVAGWFGARWGVRWARPYFDRRPWLKRFAAGLGVATPAVAACNAALVAVDIAIFGVRHALILTALGVSLPLSTVTGIAAISILAGFVSLMPMGLGGYDLGMAVLLVGVGVPRDVAVAVPVINRVVTIAVGLLLGSLASLGLGAGAGGNRLRAREGSA